MTTAIPAGEALPSSVPSNLAQAKRDRISKLGQMILGGHLQPVSPRYRTAAP
jgi:hypothetical protein